MTSEGPIPGFAEICDWPIKPQLPLRMKHFGAYRDPQPYCTYYVDLEDASGTVHHFFFDRFLGRLCYGKIDDDDSAAYLKKGSRIQVEVFAIIDELCRNNIEYSEVQEHLYHARNYL